MQQTWKIRSLDKQLETPAKTFMPEIPEKGSTVIEQTRVVSCEITDFEIQHNNHRLKRLELG